MTVRTTTQVVVLCGLLQFAVNPASADWADALRKSQQQGKASGSPDRKDGERITDGIGIDVTERLSDPLGKPWSASLRKEKSAREDPRPKPYRELISKLAELDTEIPDSELGKALLFSELAPAFLLCGDYVTAEQLGLRSTRMAEVLAGTQSREVLSCVRALIDIYEHLADFDSCARLAAAGLNVCSRKPELAVGYRAQLLASLAFAQVHQGEIQKATENSSTALELARKEGKENLHGPLIARAACFSALRDHEKARELLEEAVQRASKAKPAPNREDFSISKTFESSLLITGMRNSAANGSITQLLERSRGNAQSVNYRDVIGFLGLQETVDRVSSVPRIEAMRALLQCQLAQGDAKAAAATLDALKKRKTGSADSRPLELASLTESTAVSAWLAKDEKLGRKTTAEWVDFHREQLPNALQLVESQRLDWQRQYLNFSLPVAFSSPATLADLILQWKGVVLDSLVQERVEIRRASSDGADTKLEELATLRRKLAQQMLQQGDGSASRIEFLKNQVTALEREFAKRSARSPGGSAPTLEAVQRALPEHSVLVEYITYRPLPDIWNGAECVGALVISRTMEPRWIPMGPAEDINRTLGEMQRLIQASTGNDPALAAALSTLHRSLFAAIEEALPEKTRTVYLSPDGALNFVPFASLLMPNNAFIGEKYTLAHVSGGRDLLRTAASRQNKGDFLVFANPDFAAPCKTTKPVDPSATRSGGLSTLSGIQLPPLPGTELEADKVCRSATELGWKPHLVKGADATEDRLSKIHSPDVLHLATHGFFLGDHHESASSNNRGMKSKALPTKEKAPADSPTTEPRLSPMLQSGVAVAGAQATLEAWSKGQAPDPANDGILTAEEVGSLELSGTWLVTLSACETGVGEARSGEGVFGMRRAFMLAGCRNLLVTLWPVSDSATAAIMSDFYAQALPSKDAVEALAAVQRAWLVKLRATQGLATAVRDAGPFAIATIGSATVAPDIAPAKNKARK